MSTFYCHTADVKTSCAILRFAICYPVERGCYFSSLAPQGLSYPLTDLYVRSIPNAVNSKGSLTSDCYSRTSPASGMPKSSFKRFRQHNEHQRASHSPSRGKKESGPVKQYSESDSLFCYCSYFPIFVYQMHTSVHVQTHIHTQVK